MKPLETKQEFIRLRAAGYSYQSIAQQLQISKSTCTAWDHEMATEISNLKAAQLDELYTAFNMKKAARIQQLGEQLARIDTALAQVDLSEIPPDKLLDYKLKYMDALKREYVTSYPAFQLEDIQPRDIVAALADLLNRVRAGEITSDTVAKESIILSNLLKAYDTAELQDKVETLRQAVGR